jgi:D-inositol-3-phosphate glycosyltransferase
MASTFSEKAELIHLYHASEETICVIPCGVDTELFCLQEKTLARKMLGLGAEKIVLFVGRIEPLKGIENLIKALALIPNSYSVRLLIIGGDDNSKPEIDRLIHLAQTLNIAEKVQFLGAISQEYLPQYHSASDVVTVTSYYESFCLVILEALACGTPVVATKVGVALEIFNKTYNGLMLKDNSPNNIAKGISFALDSTFDKQMLRDIVLKYRWQRVVEQIESEYRKMVLMIYRRWQ